MRPLLLALALLASTSHAQTVIDGVPVPEELMSLARKVVASNAPKEALLRGGSALTAHPFFQELMKQIDFNQINEEAAKLMVQTFTRGEMYALVEFQQSPEGKSISQKMPYYQQMVGGLIQNAMKTGTEKVISKQATQGAQSPNLLQAPATPKPVVPWAPPTATQAPTPPTTPATPAPALKGEGGSVIGQ